MNDVAWALQTARQVGPIHPPHAHAHPIHKAHLTHTGPLRSHVAGRTDHLPSQVPNGSFVLPADIVSGLGEGNTEAGFKIAKRMFEGAHRAFGGLPYAGDNGPYGQGGGLPYAIVKGHAAGGPIDEPAGQEPAPLEGIMAYHGSPHQFDQFDASKIGTGEGAQAYGHGLYFAQNEGVARDYRDKLARDVSVGGKPLASTFWNDSPLDTAQHSVGSLVANGVHPEAAVKRAAAEWRQSGDDYMRHAKKIPEAADEARRHHAIADAIESLNPADFVKNPGHMYQVRINAHPDHFLDWDKPLSEQSEHVRKAFHHTEAPTYPDTPGQHLMGFLSPNAASASKEMQKRGIRGIRYLDQGSRGQGEGTHNYVVFDPKDIQIMRRYAQGGDVEADQQAVPVAVAGGEHVLAPHEVAFAGLGDTEAGHKALEAFVLRQRAKLIKTLKGLPGPSRD